MTTDNLLDTENKFGTYAPSAITQWSLSIGHKNWGAISRLFSSIARRIVSLEEKEVVDIEAEQLRIRTYPHDNRCERTFAYNPYGYDQLEREFIAKLLPTQGVFLDIGANAGIYSLHAAKHLERNGKVVSIEAGSQMFKRLRFNFKSTDDKLNFTCNINLLNLGVSDREEELMLHHSDTNMGSSTVKKTHSSNYENVKCKALDKILDENNIDHIDILKIDVEGAEDKILPHFFEVSSPTIYPKHIIIEHAHADWKVDLLRLMSELGYKTQAKTRLNTILSIS